MGSGRRDTSAGRIGALNAAVLAANAHLEVEERMDAAEALWRSHAMAVVATSGVTNLSVVFRQGGEHPSPDDVRGIRYVETELTEQHVLASAAIPVAFPAVDVEDARAPGWYFDGGTRLNTPIKPAKALGAERVIVVALHSLTTRSDAIIERRPDAFDGAAQLAQAVLVDPLVNDVHTLVAYNEMLDGARGRRRPMPYIVIAPQDPDEIGEPSAPAHCPSRGRRDELRVMRSDDGGVIS